MDDEGGVIAVQGERTVAGFEKTLNGKAQRFLDLKAKAASGDAAAQIDFALLEGELGRVPFEDLKKRLAGKKLSDAQTAALGDVELGAMMAVVQGAQDEATARAGLKVVADAFASGRLPADTQRRQTFLGFTLSYALSTEDAALAQKAFEPLKALIEEEHGKDNEQVKEWVRKVGHKIADLRAASEEQSGSDEGIEEGCGEESGEK